MSSLLPRAHLSPWNCRMDPVLECYLKKDKVSISWEEDGAPKTDGDALVCNVLKDSPACSFDEIFFFHFFSPFQFWKVAFKLCASHMNSQLP